MEISNACNGKKKYQRLKSQENREKIISDWSSTQKLPSLAYRWKDNAAGKKKPLEEVEMRFLSQWSPFLMRELLSNKRFWTQNTLGDQ